MKKPSARARGDGPVPFDFNSAALRSKMAEPEDFHLDRDDAQPASSAVNNNTTVPCMANLEGHFGVRELRDGRRPGPCCIVWAVGAFGGRGGLGCAPAGASQARLGTTTLPMVWARRNGWPGVTQCHHHHLRRGLVRRGCVLGFNSRRWRRRRRRLDNHGLGSSNGGPRWARGGLGLEPDQPDEEKEQADELTQARLRS